ncbi:glycoside hydrolase family 36 protein [Cohnella lubricantis]|uniref:Alpha-galactosidase n=1 Tax=Cohnella lubricantis TaxID=2163172 RepID=A0A841TD52_9BACL|nr:glycoside hydrolase family 36 protein [Cohnella lubricantis]MBB6677929.1 alpha-galactosidase [Cohnella lubricantis]MBP2120334.1 alpha-galactosidase [Cohnella lubricantis]
MRQLRVINENNLYFVLGVTESDDVRLLHLSSTPPDVILKDEKQQKRARLVEVHVTGENQNDHHGSKHTGSMPGGRLKYKNFKDDRNQYGRKLEITLQDDGLIVTSHLQFYDNVQVVRSWTVVENIGGESKGLEYISSFALTGICHQRQSGWENEGHLYIPHNTWYGEAQWKKQSMAGLGMYQVNDFSMKRVALSSSGTWPCSEYLPMGCYESTDGGRAIMWQIENNGAWHWEISDIANQLYLQLSGPTERESHWWKLLRPGEAFETASAAIAFVNGGFDEAVGELTKYRRKIRRNHIDNEKLPVIFNDYMNCLFGDPTTEKLIPLIDAAAETGCEYFCIDAGWYSDGEWWDGVGEWLPSTARFPGGIQEPLNYIRKKGMIPGLWLELEVMGMNCPLVNVVSDEWFFKRHGKPVIDHGRYQLDFRNPEVVQHADRVIERLVKDYGVGYIKMDYNIDAGFGTEVGADSFGDGLLQHNRAYLIWLDSIFDRYPDLVIENCGSGGMRMEYSLLSRHSIQSVTDQTDYRRMAAIAAASPSAVTPEQAAIWSYPLKEGDKEEVIFNMVNSLLLRIHQSGHLAEISNERLTLVKEGISCYKEIRNDIRSSLPFWPLGLPTFTDEWISLGLSCDYKLYLAVWRLNGTNSDVNIPIKHAYGKKSAVRCIYPQEQRCSYKWDEANSCLNVRLENHNARLFEIYLSDLEG